MLKLKCPMAFDNQVTWPRPGSVCPARNAEETGNSVVKISVAWWRHGDSNRRNRARHVCWTDAPPHWCGLVVICPRDSTAAADDRACGRECSPAEGSGPGEMAGDSSSAATPSKKSIYDNLILDSLSHIIHY